MRRDFLTAWGPRILMGCVFGGGLWGHGYYYAGAWGHLIRGMRNGEAASCQLFHNVLFTAQELWEPAILMFMA